MRRTLSLLALTLLVTACGDDAVSTDDDEPGTEVRTTPVELGDGDEVWLRVETGGGFVPQIVNLRQVPSLLLFDDGRLVRRVDEEDRFDEVVPDFEVVRLDESGVAGLLDRFAAVVDGPDPGEPEVTDLPSTSIEVTTGGDTRDLSIYALGFDDDGSLSDEEADAREAATDAIDDASALDTAESYVPEEWLVLTLATGQAGEPDVVWPLEGERVAGADTPAVCTRITGEEVDEVLAALAEGDGGVGGTIGGPGGNSEIALRPVLVGDEQCNLSDSDEFVER